MSCPIRLSWFTRDTRAVPDSQREHHDSRWAVGHHTALQAAAGADRPPRWRSVTASPQPAPSRTPPHAPIPAADFNPCAFVLISHDRECDSPADSRQTFSGTTGPEGGLGKPPWPPTLPFPLITGRILVLPSHWAHRQDQPRNSQSPTQDT